MNMGAYKTKIVLFDSYNCKYEVIEQTAEDEKENVELAGKDLPKFNSKFDSNQKDYMVQDSEKSSSKVLEILNLD